MLEFLWLQQRRTFQQLFCVSAFPCRLYFKAGELGLLLGRQSSLLLVFVSGRGFFVFVMAEGWNTENREAPSVSYSKSQATQVLVQRGTAG